MFTTPQSSRPPQRTYGRRSNGKRPPPREIPVDTGSSTETEDANDADSRVSTPVGGAGARSSAKRARTTTPGSKDVVASPSSTPGMDVVVQAPSVSPHTGYNDTPVRPALALRLSAVSRESTPGQSQNESQGSTGSVGGGARRAPRRMLSKAQSMANHPKDETPPSTPQKLRASQSMPITPGSATSVKTDGSLPGSPIPSLLAPVAPASPSTAGGRVKKTYGRNRTFLGTEMTVDSVPRESYADLRKRYEVDNEPGNESEGSRNLLAELQLARAPEAISDMRSKGESKRFTDEVSYLLGGITDASSTALRRHSSIDVLRNMQEDGWVARLERHGEIERLFEALCTARGDDEVMQSVVLLFLAILAHRQSLGTLVQSDPDAVAAVVLSNWGAKNGPLDPGYKGKVTNAIQQLRGIAKGLDDDDEHTTSTREAASLILVQMCQDWGHVEQAVSSRNLASRALTSVAAELRPLSDRLELYAKGLDIMPKEGDVDMPFIQHCLEALSMMVAAAPEERSRLAEDGQAVQDVMSGTTVMSLIATDSDQPRKLREQAARCAVLALEFMTPLVSLPSMTHTLASARDLPGFIPSLARLLVGRQQIVAILAKSPSLRDADADGLAAGADVNAEDIPYFILAIFGAMIDSDSGAASTIASTAVATCGKRACAVTCHCGGEKLATALTEQYANVKSTDEAFKSYVGGYLAFLLTQLLQFAPESRALIEPSLPGADRDAKLQGLGERVGELKSLREVAHRKMRDLVETATGDDGAGISANIPGAEDNEKLHEAMRFLEREVRR